DAGVAGGAFDHGAAGRQLAALLGVRDDRARGPVLDRTAGIHELRFAENLTAGLFTQRPQPDQRRVADRADKAFDQAHASAPGAAGAAGAPAGPMAATAPTIRGAGGVTASAVASAVRWPRLLRRMRCWGRVARSMIATGCSAAAPAARSRATIPGSCATPM